MSVAHVSGIDLYYESHGEGPALVFLHGAAGNHISWWQQVPAFRGRYRCITIDHRGFGASTDPQGEGAARFVDDLEALLEQLEVERIALVAQSMGGRTALGFAVRHPDRVSALVMADTWGSFDWPALQERAEQLREQAAAKEGDAPLSVRALGEAFRRREPALAFLYQQVAALNPPRVQVHSPSEVTKEQVAALAVPTLFIAGSDDTLTPPSLLRAVHELMPGSDYHEFAGCGHSVYWEHATAFNETLSAFLGKHMKDGTHAA